MNNGTPNTLPERQELLDLLEYDPVSGVLTWKERPTSDFIDNRSAKIWNTRYANKTTGCKVWNAYGNPSHLVVMFKKKPYVAHRLIWVMVNGGIEEGCMIDHKDRDPFNNSISNLRPC